MSADLLAGHLTSPQSLNRYTFTRNDPVNLVDPSGLDILQVCVTTTVNWTQSFDGSETSGSNDSTVCTITDNGGGGGVGGSGGGDPGGGGGDGDNQASKPSISRKLYEDCAKDAFGKTKGTISGTDKSIPSFDAATATFDAATFEGVDPGLVGATMALESNSQLDMSTNLNRNGTLDYGPMQINSDYVGKSFPNYPGATGSNLGPGDAFNGDPVANIASGAFYLRKLGQHPERYVGRRGASARKKALSKLLGPMDKFYDCIRKGLGL